MMARPGSLARAAGPEDRDRRAGPLRRESEHSDPDRPVAAGGPPDSASPPRQGRRPRDRQGDGPAGLSLWDPHQGNGSGPVDKYAPCSRPRMGPDSPPPENPDSTAPRPDKPDQPPPVPDKPGSAAARAIIPWTSRNPQPQAGPAGAHVGRRAHARILAGSPSARGCRGRDGATFSSPEASNSPSPFLSLRSFSAGIQAIGGTPLFPRS